jgi:hypothetical protein
MNRLTGLAFVLAALTLPSTAAAAPLNALPFEQTPGVATCLRGAGAPGDLVLYGRDGVDLRVAGSSGTAAVAPVGIRRLAECAAVAMAPGGAGVVAGAVRGDPMEVRAATRDPGAVFGTPVRLGVGAPFATSVSVAVSPPGHAVVAWAQFRGRPDPRRPARFRIVAARRAPGGGFGTVEPLTAWRRGPSVAAAKVQTGMDAAGIATVAWAQPRPGQAFDARFEVGVASATPGARFAVQTLAARVADLRRVALAVAPDGWALLAYDGASGVRGYERAPRANRFAEVMRSESPLATGPAVAVGEGGGGLVAWRTDGSEKAGADVAVRSGPGAFGAARTLAHEALDDSLSGFFVALVSLGGPPDDPEAGAMRAALAPDGRALVAWPAERSGLGATSSPRLAAGSLDGGFAATVELGSPIRDAEGVAPLFLPDGRAALAWTDNAGQYEANVPSDQGRLHLAVESAAPLPEQPAPRLTLRARPTQRLYRSQAPRVTATCAEACDLQASITAPRESATSIVRTLTAGRRARLRFALLEPADSMRIVARATAPGGRAAGRASVRVRVIRRPALPVPATLDVRARRRGRSIFVSWRAAGPARRTSYFVEGRRRRGGRFDIYDRGSFRGVNGRGRTSFTARLRPRRSARVKWVAVTAYSFDGPRRDPVIVEVR